MKKLTPFKLGWWSIDLGSYRPHPTEFATYSLFPYETLPPLPEAKFKGKLQWLEEMPREDEEQEDTTALVESEQYIWLEDEMEGEYDMQERLQKLVASAQKLGLSLPDPFLKVMSSPELQALVPSCTACYFDLPEDIVRCPGTEDGYVIRFLDDQQWCILWYLYITPRGEHCVLASGYCLDQQEDADSENEADEEDRADTTADIWECAPSFEAFLYRFCLENTIWFKLSHWNKSPLPLTEEEERYVMHYKGK